MYKVPSILGAVCLFLIFPLFFSFSVKLNKNHVSRQIDIKQHHFIIPTINNIYKRKQNIPLKSTLSLSSEASEGKTNQKSNSLVKRWITGLSLGVLGTLWIASGNGPFTLGFLITSLIAQNEYYYMVRATGVYPAWKTGTVCSILCYLTAAMFPIFHELVMPLSAFYLMVWFLIFNKKSALISEISTSLLGMFYLGYLPSFWVRMRSLDSLNKIRFTSALMKPLPDIWLQPEYWPLGKTVTWWTWTSIVFADVGAYFIGKKFGKTKLSRFSSAAGAASPNKTVEGALGGFFSCSIIAVIGAYLMHWPMWFITGSLYGLMISFIALVGDLTASMMKRDAGFKDTGKLLPGHGGLLDRIDSYMFTAPAAYFFFKHIFPWVQSIVLK